MPWLKLDAGVIDDPKILMLAFEDRWHFVAILACAKRGILDDPDLGLVREMVRLKVGLDPEHFEKAVSRLARVRLIDPDTLRPAAWDKWQTDADSDAVRARRYREKQSSRASRDGRDDTSRDSHEGEGRREKGEGERSKAPEPAYAGSESIADAMDAPPSPESSPETASTQGDDNAHRGVPRTPPCPVEQIVALYHAKLPMCRRVEQLTPNRRASLRARWRNELPTLEAFGNYFDDVAASRFLTGRVNGHGDRKPFVADFDWLLKPSNFVKVLEGKYHDGQ